MQKNFHKLMRALKKNVGKFMHLRIAELQQDGFPHIHVLLVGSAIAPKKILDHIRDLWCHKYGMGNIDLVVLKHGLGAGVNYITKYITKDIKQVYKGARIFSSSKGALEPLPKKQKWEASSFYFGYTKKLKNDEPEVIERCLFPKIPDWLDWNEIMADLQNEIDKFSQEIMKL